MLQVEVSSMEPVLGGDRGGWEVGGDTRVQEGGGGRWREVVVI